MTLKSSIGDLEIDGFCWAVRKIVNRKYNTKTFPKIFRLFSIENFLYLLSRIFTVTSLNLLICHFNNKIKTLIKINFLGILKLYHVILRINN